MTRDLLTEATRLLQQPRATLPADGLDVIVLSITAHSDDEVRVRYAVPPLPDGVAYVLRPRGLRVEEWVRQIRRELHGWSTEHVRRYRPLPPPDLDAVKRELPDRDALWDQLRGRFATVVEVDGGLHGTIEGQTVTLVVTPEQWQDHVARCEVGARRDAGEDAARPGDGPFLAWEGLDWDMESLDEGEQFVVFDGRRFHPSTRRELPPVRSGVRERRHKELLERTGGRGEWRAFPPGQDGRGSTRD